MKAAILLVSAATLVWLLAACADESEDLPSDDSATPAPSPAPTFLPTETAAPTPSPSATPATAGEYTTYTDPTYGYSFEYPASWTLNPTKDGMVTLYSYDPASVPPGEVGQPVPRDKLKVIFRVEQTGGESIDDWLAQGDATVADQGLPTPQVLSRTDEQLAGKEAVSRETISDDWPSLAHYIAIRPDHLLIIGVGPADSVLIDKWHSILGTLRIV